MMSMTVIFRSICYFESTLVLCDKQSVFFYFSVLSNINLFLLFGLRGLGLSSRSELHQVLERRKRVQSDQENEGQSRTPLDDVLLRHQQKILEVVN